MHKILGMRKMSAWWVPRFLTPNNKHSGETTLRKAKMSYRLKERMVTVFWVSLNVIYINYLKKVKMVTGLYYGELLGCIVVKLQNNGYHLAKKRALPHDNVSAHTFFLIMRTILAIAAALQQIWILTYIFFSKLKSTEILLEWDFITYCADIQNNKFSERLKNF